VFWLVFLTALPAALPFLMLRDPAIAMRISNAILIAVALLGIALVLVAIPLGG